MASKGITPWVIGVTEREVRDGWHKEHLNKYSLEFSKFHNNYKNTNSINSRQDKHTNPLTNLKKKKLVLKHFINEYLKKNWVREKTLKSCQKKKKVHIQQTKDNNYYGLLTRKRSSHRENLTMSLKC